MLLFKKPLYELAAYSPQRTTSQVLHGTILATSLLSLLLILYNGIANSVWLSNSVWVLILVFVYLFTAKFLLRRSRQLIANWMLILFYLLLSLVTLLLWGLNAPVGILTISFALILPSILMGARAILPVTLFSIAVLVYVQHIHQAKVLAPNLASLSLPSSYWDVLTYSTILAIFALVSWLATSQREKSLLRALEAESALKEQKEALSIELEKESAELRLSQLSQIQQLHRFALFGQSAAATLHELSNHLSILNLDIDDLHQQHSNSQVISSAKDGIKHINKMVHQARRQLNSYDQHESFEAIAVVKQSVNDLSEKFLLRNIYLPKPTIKGGRFFTTHGSRLALMQIITILLNNAFDASYNTSDAKVQIEIENKRTLLKIHVIDTGIGIDEETATGLFNPVRSGKPTGLGIGLYIAQHLAKDQLSGNIELIPSTIGAHFVVNLPKVKA